MKSRSALHFVLILGIANFFADFTYEGARGIIGPFLGSLGASAAIVGFVAGLGELMGYGLRSISGYLADKSANGRAGMLQRNNGLGCRALLCGRSAVDSSC